METVGNQNQQNSASKFYCSICDYATSRKCNYDTHILSSKHMRNTQKEIDGYQNQQKISKNKHFCQKCDKEFANRSGLWKHNKKCGVQSDNQNPNQITPELIIMLIQQNKEMQNMMMEVIKNGVNTNNTNHSHNTTNSHNKTFNLQIFLNETCKDAMNIMDFVDQIILNLNDLEETGRLGFAEGISKMILNRLKTLDVTQRPIHCSDLKRETLYIKDENKWEKEQESKPILTKAVKEIAGKNIRQIKEWQKKYPDYNDPESKRSDKYMNMVMNVMAGGTPEEIQENYEKIIKNITKESTIDKDKFSV
jgi:hypothetical protein